MRKRWGAIALLIIALFAMSGCESEVEKAQRRLEESTKEAQEARQKANDAKEKVEMLESLLGYD